MLLKKVKSLVKIATLAIVMFALSGCGGDKNNTVNPDVNTAKPEVTPNDTAPEVTTLSIYTARDQEVIDVVEAKFIERYPEYELEVTAMGAQEILERVRAESANPQADFWWGGTQSSFQIAAKEGLLDSYKPTFADKIDTHYKDANDLWYGEILLPEVIMYNTNALTQEEAPQDWDELLDAKWKDKIIIRGVLPSGTMRTIYNSMIYKEDPTNPEDPQKGFDWLAKLDANTKAYSENPAALYVSLAREEGLVSLWNLQDIMIQKETNNQPFGYIIPKSGAPILVDAVGIVKGAKNAEGAKKFYELLFEEEMKIMLAEDTYQIPAMSGLSKDKLPEWLNGIDLKVMDVDWSILAEKDMIWMEYWDENIKGKN